MKMLRIILLIFSVISIANAAWMLLDPEHWYHHLPAHVPEYGPLNLHFVRDIGIAFLVSGLGLGAAAIRPYARRAFVLGAALFYAGHASVHLYELLTGGPASHLWKGESMMVYFPALFLCAITLFLYGTQPK